MFRRYLGSWDLIPELCLYPDETPAVEQASYQIRPDGDDLGFTLTLRIAGKDSTSEFSGPLNSDQPPQAAPGQIGFEFVSDDPGVLDSAARRDGNVVAWGRRRVDAAGQLMVLVQDVRAPDGSWNSTTQIYRRRAS